MVIGAFDDAAPDGADPANERPRLPTTVASKAPTHAERCLCERFMPTPLLRPNFTVLRNLVLLKMHFASVVYMSDSEKVESRRGLG